MPCLLGDQLGVLVAGAVPDITFHCLAPLFLFFFVLDPDQSVLNLVELVEQSQVLVLDTSINLELRHLDCKIFIQAQLPHFGLAEVASDFVLLLSELSSHL